tara:strand:- start:1076 stop:1306 length:231 start_codon:yes stop_codon:yes gene_type:complete
MIEFSILDFILISSTLYLLGVLTGLTVCCHNKEKFLQRERSVEDLSRMNHQNIVYPPEASVITAASAPTFTEISIK